MKKALLVMLGPSGAGKSTIRRNLCGIPLQEVKTPIGTECTLYKDFAVVGKHTDGAEGLKSIYKMKCAIRNCFRRREFVIFDTVRTNKNWYNSIFKYYDSKKCRLIVLYFDLSQKENIKRIKERRGGVAELPKSTFLGNKRDRKRAKEAFDYFDTKKKIVLLTTDDTISKQELIWGVKRHILQRS